MPSILAALCLIVAGSCRSAAGQSCSVGENANSSFSSQSFVFGYVPNGPSEGTQGDFGIYIITQEATQGVFIRPTALEGGGGPLSPIPDSRYVEIDPPDAVGTQFDQEKEVFYILTEANAALMAVSGGPEAFGDSYGTYAVIPSEYLGQEYFVFVRASPSPGRVIISTLDSLTRIKIRFNAEAVINGITYEHGDEVELSLRSWTQLTILTETEQFSGSRILSSQPVSVISGTMCAFSPDSSTPGICDHVIEQLTPFDRWGTVFHIPTFPEDDDFYVLIVAGRDDTIVTKITADSNTETVADLNQGDSIMLFINDTMTILNSNKPLQVVALKKENAAMVIIPPVEQYITGETYIYVPNADKYGVSSYVITIVTNCYLKELFRVYKLPNNGSHPEYVSSVHSTHHAGICAIYYDVDPEYTYNIRSLFAGSPYYTLLTSYCASTAAASVGAQRFLRLRCFDDSQFNHEATTIVDATYRSSRYSLAFRDQRIRRHNPDQQCFSRTSWGCARACAHQGDAHCKVFTWSKLTGDCQMYESLSASTDLNPQIDSYVYWMNKDTI